MVSDEEHNELQTLVNELQTLVNEVQTLVNELLQFEITRLKSRTLVFTLQNISEAESDRGSS